MPSTLLGRFSVFKVTKNPQVEHLERQAGRATKLSVPTAFGVNTLMITNLTLMCEFLIGPTGVKVLPIKADCDCTLDVEERHPLGQSVEKSRPMRVCPVI